MQYPAHIRIATRSSKLALAQAYLVRDALSKAAQVQGFDLLCEIIPMQTSGDKNLDHPLSEIGGKGLFTKELETSLLTKTTDIAVHSLKDMPTQLPEGLILGAVLEREDPSDVLVSDYPSLEALPNLATVGTSSLRRAALVKSVRPDLNIIPFRGNVNTRLEKIRARTADATLLALAGLKRLGLESHASCILDPAVFTPAVGQGVICIECREGDAVTMALLQHIHHAQTQYAVDAERSLLRVLDGSCRTPIGGYASLSQNTLTLRGFVATLDGSTYWRTERIGSADDAVRMGEDAGRELKARAGSAVFSHD
jgi:hydroxymethylbilane synthase